MRNVRLQWVLAVVLTLVSAYWQRVSGPTHPLRHTIVLGSEEMTVRLTRTHGGPGDQPVRIEAPDGAIAGDVVWRRYPTNEPWRTVPLSRAGGWLEGSLPHQPPAGKLEYQVRLRRGSDERVVPDRPAVTRFKGDVSPIVLVPHILAMFVSMLLSTRAGLGALGGTAPHRTVWWAFACLAVGGFVLGPAVQKQAFDAWWTGVPWGWDLTDNKTLIAGVVWAWALWRMRGGRNARWAVIGAAAVVLVVFAIPHSVWGSEITWR